MRLAALLTEPRLRKLDIESPERIRLHATILAEKKIMRSVFENVYRLSLELDRRWFRDTPGLRVELGAGVSFFKQLCSELVVTDIKGAEHLDVVVDAQAMPFGDGAVRTLFGTNVFHHLPDPDSFFREAMRVLQPGGGIVLIEPHSGPVSGFVHTRLFTTECFDKTAAEWSSPARAAMRGANQALSYVVFVRDRGSFEARYPQLEIVEMTTVPNYLRYLLSGGLNFRQLWPDFAVGALRRLERLLLPVQPLLALHQAIVLRKKAGSGRHAAAFPQ